MNDSSRLLELQQQSFELYDYTIRLVEKYKNFILFNLFEDILFKFTTYLSIIDSRIPLNEHHIEILTDTESLYSKPGTQFLFQLANCINQYLQFDLDPVHCVMRPGILQNFINLLIICCVDMTNTLDQMILDFRHIYPRENVFLSKFKQRLGLFHTFLSNFTGEWYDNLFEYYPEIPPPARIGED